jgi:hypothetical protein
VDSCLEFYPKVGITCEGENKNMKVLLEVIEKTRQQLVVEEGGYIHQFLKDLIAM